MKQVGILLLMTIMCSAVAATETANKDCLMVEEIYYENITISWNTTCFNDDHNKYLIEFIGKDCRKTGYPCTNNPCRMNTAEMGCRPNPTTACSDVTMKVTGEASDVNFTLTTRVAPWIRDHEWQLVQSNETWNNISWGPADNPDSKFVSCATKAKFTATCSSQDGDNCNNSTVKDGLNPPAQGNVEFDISKCPSNKNLTCTLEITYMSDDVLTKTTWRDEIDFIHIISGSRNVYPQNVVVYSGIAILFGILKFNYGSSFY